MAWLLCQTNKITSPSLANSAILGYSYSATLPPAPQTFLIVVLTIATMASFLLRLPFWRPFQFPAIERFHLCCHALVLSTGYPQGGSRLYLSRKRRHCGQGKAGANGHPRPAPSLCRRRRAAAPALPAAEERLFVRLALVALLGFPRDPPLPHFASVRSGLAVSATSAIRLRFARNLFPPLLHLRLHPRCRRRR